MTEYIYSSEIQDERSQTRKRCMSSLLLIPINLLGCDGSIHPVPLWMGHMNMVVLGHRVPDRTGQD